MLVAQQKRIKQITRVIAAFLKRTDRVYSGEIQQVIPLVNINHIQAVLRNLEKKGVLKSVLVDPPHDGQRRGGMQRRYYYR
jgi:hypothetical protein